MRLAIRWLTVALASATVSGTADTAAAQAKEPRALTVRLYNGAGLPVADVMDAALGTAEPLLHATGIGVSFRFCGMPEPCEGRLGPTDVVVRIIDTPPASTASERAYGVAYVIQPMNQGWLATVFADRVAEGASRVRLERRQLLGLVIAHEVGHLLLGDGHAATGLMSPHWHDVDLKRTLTASASSVWQFSEAEAVVIQERLNER